jgi:hypothetical protein
VNSKQKIFLARVIAVTADLVQIGLFPVTAEGVLSPLSDMIDVVVCAVLIWLLGWHIAFVPSFVIKMLPMVDLAPTWSIAVFLATRKGDVAGGVGEIEEKKRALS